MVIKNEEQAIKNLTEDLEGYTIEECDILTTKAIEVLHNQQKVKSR